MHFFLSVSLSLSLSLSCLALLLICVCVFSREFMVRNIKRQAHTSSGIWLCYRDNSGNRMAWTTAEMYNEEQQKKYTHIENFDDDDDDDDKKTKGKKRTKQKSQKKKVAQRMLAFYVYSFSHCLYRHFVLVKQLNGARSVWATEDDRQGKMTRCTHYVNTLQWCSNYGR